MGSRTVLVLLVLPTIGLAIDVALMYRTCLAVKALGECPAHRRLLPCEAIPIRFVLDDPVCADRLLRAMNVTNVGVIEKASGLPGQPVDLARQIDRYLQNKPR